MPAKAPAARMSQDDAKKSRQRKPAGTSRPKAPPARKPGSKEPKATRVDKDRLPRVEQDVGSSPEPQATSSLPQHWPSWLFFGAGAFVLVIFILAQFGGGSSSNNAAAPVPPTEEPPLIPTTPTTPTTPEEPPSPPPKPSPPKQIWEHEITVEMNTSFNIDHFPIKNLPTGFVVSDAAGPGEGLEVVAAGKMAPWKGGGTPTYKNCVNTLGSTTGTEHIALQSSGQWICAETATHRIARFRFDGNSGYQYSFLVTVWRR
jgi:hypothetical protein